MNSRDLQNDNARLRERVWALSQENEKLRASAADELSAEAQRLGMYDARMATKKKKPSGVNIPNSQRKTVQILLRVPVDVKEDLDDLAERWGLTRSGAVARLVEEAKPDDD